ncbi:hypothetical protein GQ600_18543 [Phytophthora cactorum]|nr:hypothetical protein GQ600_18543 [Phytophthora cactorum]
MSAILLLTRCQNPSGS